MKIVRHENTDVHMVNRICVEWKLLTWPKWPFLAQLKQKILLFCLWCWGSISASLTGAPPSCDVITYTSHSLSIATVGFSFMYIYDRPLAHAGYNRQTACGILNH